MRILAVCDTCQHKHVIEFSPLLGYGTAALDFSANHIDCEGVRFLWPGRTQKRRHTRQRGRLSRYLDNANVNVQYGASVAYTFTSLNSLASDSNLLAGASSLAVDNTVSFYDDFLIAGLIKNNTSNTPTAGKEIDVYAYRAYDDTLTYPDVLAGTDAAKTITTVNMINAGLKLLASITVAATQSQVNPFDAGSLAAYFGGNAPNLHALWVVQNSGQALAASGNALTYKPVYYRVV